LEERPITLELTKGVLKDLLKEPKKLITVDFIQRCVAEEFGLSLQDLKTKRRNKNIVLPRQIAMYLSRELTELSLPEIGDFLGQGPHHGPPRGGEIHLLLQEDPKLRKTVETLNQEIAS